MSHNKKNDNQLRDKQGLRQDSEAPTIYEQTIQSEGKANFP